MEAPNILVIRLRELGDTLLTTPLLRQLKKLNPDARIDFLTEPRSRPLLNSNPNIDDIIEWKRNTSMLTTVRLIYRLRRNRYDWVLDSQSMPKTALVTSLSRANYRSGFHRRYLRTKPFYTSPVVQSPLMYTAVSNLRLMRSTLIDPNDIELDFFLPQISRTTTFNKIPGLARSLNLVALNPMTRFSERRWSLAKFAAIAQRLNKSGWKSVVVFGPGEEATVKELTGLAGQDCFLPCPLLDLQELCALLEHCKLYVGNDGGPKHIAVAARTPTLTIFGQSPDPWTPHNTDLHRAISRRLHGSGFKTRGVEIVAADTIDDISVDDVWKEVKLMLKRVDIPRSIAA